MIFLVSMKTKPYLKHHWHRIQTTESAMSVKFKKFLEFFKFFFFTSFYMFRFFIILFANIDF